MCYLSTMKEQLKQLAVHLYQERRLYNYIVFMIILENEIFSNFFLLHGEDPPFIQHVQFLLYRKIDTYQ